jgi:N6-L-threonylcarbamoyladenine synthase
MKSNKIVIGIDTSAYTTSIAAVNQAGQILYDVKQLLQVPKGNRGLRQSDARAQHHANLAVLSYELEQAIDMDEVGAIAVSNRPRPVEGSYMPVFMDGVEFGAKLANRLHVPLFYFSHQEGHIEAVKHFSPMRDISRFLCFHLSGGTSELLLVTDESPVGPIQIIGGSKDLSFGQLIDRVGVSLGMEFPAGKQMDEIASGKKCETDMLKPIPITGLSFNLSGIETQCQRTIEAGAQGDELIVELFHRISRCLCKVCDTAFTNYNVHHILMVGGVSGSRTIQSEMNHCLKNGSPVFGTFSSDNAVGIALLGGNTLWQ